LKYSTSFYFSSSGEDCMFMEWFI